MIEMLQCLCSEWKSQDSMQGLSGGGGYTHSTHFLTGGWSGGRLQSHSLKHAFSELFMIRQVV